MENFSEFERSGTAPSQDAGSIISHAWENYKGIIGYTLLYALIGGVAYALLSAILPGSSQNAEVYREIIESLKDGKSLDIEAIRELQGSMGWSDRIFASLLGIVFGALLYPLNAGLMYIAYKYNNKKEIETSDLFIGYKQNTVNLIIYGGLITLLATIGIYICILPGLYIWMTSFIGLPIIFFENKTAGDALKKSFEITNAQIGTFIATVIISWIISFSGLFLCCIGLLLTMGFNMSVKYSLYCAFCGTPREIAQ